MTSHDIGFPVREMPKFVAVASITESPLDPRCGLLAGPGSIHVDLGFAASHTARIELERRNADTRTHGNRCKVPDVPAPEVVRHRDWPRRSDGPYRALTFGSGSSRCGQAPKGVGGMPWRHQKSERGRLRNAWGSCRTSVDPGILTKTQGTETSQYLVEKKSTETPSVVASERGRA